MSFSCINSATLLSNLLSKIANHKNVRGFKQEHFRSKKEIVFGRQIDGTTDIVP